MSGSVSMNRRVCSKKYEPNNVFVRKIKGGPETELNRADRTDGGGDARVGGNRPSLA